MPLGYDPSSPLTIAGQREVRTPRFLRDTFSLTPEYGRGVPLPQVRTPTGPEDYFTSLNERAAEEFGMRDVPQAPLVRTDQPAAPLGRTGAGTTTVVGAQPATPAPGVFTYEAPGIKATSRTAPTGAIPGWLRSTDPRAALRPLDQGPVRARSLGEIESVENAQRTLDRVYPSAGYPTLQDTQAADLGARRYRQQATELTDPAGYAGSAINREMEAALGINRDAFVNQLAAQAVVEARKEGQRLSLEEARQQAGLVWLDYMGEFIRTKAGRYMEPRPIPLDTLQGYEAVAGNQFGRTTP